VRKWSNSIFVAAMVYGMAITVAGQTANPMADPRMGSWKLNLAKSTYPAGLEPQRQTLKWEPAEGGGFKLTADGVNAQGQASHTETTAKLDGKDYPVRGGQAAATRATRRLDDHTFESVDKIKGVNGELSIVRTEVFSADGKTMTNSSSRTDPQGQVVHIVAVYDKQ
jgi:hypothetical protein